MSADGKITIMFFGTLKEGSEAAFVEGFRQTAGAVRAEEDGCLVYKLYQQKDNPREIVVFEQYRDKKAVADHGAHLAAMFGPPRPGEFVPAAMLAPFEKTRLVFYDEVVG
ncbi:MAG: putative quinol monooxygenase [Chloroflexota bacterium]